MTRFVVAAMALVVSLGSAFAAEGDRCKVTDPTGKSASGPLNPRPCSSAARSMMRGRRIAHELVVREKDSRRTFPDTALAYCVIRNNRQLSFRRNKRMIVCVNCAGEWRSAFSPSAPSGDVR